MEVALKTYKKEFGHSYTFGVFPTLELLHARSAEVLKVLISDAGRKNRGVAKIEELCARRRIPVEVNDKAVDRLSPKENAYAVGVFKKYTASLAANANHLVLVNPGDMGNLGTIIRTMLGFGVTNLALVRPAADIFDPRAVRSSMGALFSIAFHYFDSFEQYHDLFPNNLYPFMTNGKVTLSQAGFARPFSLIFGNESMGLPDDYLQLGTSVTIPQSNKVDSLNLTIAVGVALYEATKQDLDAVRKPE
ncbi:MAG: TrmH family RNA methyltransferase [Chloroflexota bacterium]